MIIEGFKTYRDQTIAEPFSPKINTIGKAGQAEVAKHALLRCAMHQLLCVAVGPNGSGKSNFFHGTHLLGCFAARRANFVPDDAHALTCSHQVCVQ